MIVTNQTAATAVANDIRDLKPPIEIPSGYAWLWAGLTALAIVTVAVFFWKWWKCRQAQAAIVPVIPAHLRARQKLREALPLITQPKPFVTAVSDAERAYLEERFNFHAPERTTEEFLHELKQTDLLQKEQKESLGAFLESCDMVKFAKYEPGEPELRELYGAAMRLVDETAPQIEQAETITQEEEAKPAATSNESKMHQASKGKTLAIIGTLLQLGPSIWIVAYLVMLFRLLSLAKDASQSASSKGFGAITELYSKMLSIYGDALILVCIGLLAGVVGLVLLTISLVSSRYRSEWFFWFLIIYGALLLGAFPCIGTAMGIFFIVYSLTKRREFFDRA
jgi:hypothetical protein